MRLKLSVCFLLLIRCIQSGRVNLAWEQCRTEQVIHQPEAQAVLTGILPIRERSGEGGCGRVSLEGLEVMEAVNWALKAINQDYGTVFGQEVTSSHVPGIQIGSDLFDSCGDEHLGMQYIASQFKDMYSRSKMCSFSSTLVSLGVMEIHNRLLAFNPPETIPRFLNSSSLPILTNGVYSSGQGSKESLISISPDIDLLAEAMVGSLRKLGWESGSILHSSSEFGIQGKDAILKWARHYGLCITLQEEISTDAGDLMGKLSLGKRKGSVVMVFAALEESLDLLETYSTAQAGDTSDVELTWIFSCGVSLFNDPRLLTLPVESLRGIFTIGASSPLQIPEFDEFIQFLDPSTGNASSWIREIYQQQHRCRLQGESFGIFRDLPLCAENYKLRPSAVNSMLLPTLDAVFGIAVALKKAWAKRCRGPGLCPQLVQLPNQEYLEILRSLEFEYGTDIRAPPSLIGRKVDLGKGPDKLVLYEAVQQGDAVSIAEVHEFGSGGRVLAISKPVFYQKNREGLSVQSSTPPPSDCSDPQNCRCLEKKSAKRNVENRKSHLEHKNGDLNLLAAIPIHHFGMEPYSCGSINENGFAQAEAFWYAINNLNGKDGPFAQILGGITLGGLVVDNCDSSALSSFRLSSLLLSEEEGSKELKRSSVIGVVGGGGEVGKIVAPALLPHLAYSDPSAELDDIGRYPATVRTLVSDSRRLEAIVSLLTANQWEFVHLVYSTSSYGTAMMEDFQSLVSQTTICLASSMMITQDSAQLSEVVSKISSIPDAKIVVVFAEEAEIRTFFAAMKTGSDGKFIYVVPKFWDNSGSFSRGLEETLDGALSIEVPAAENPSFKRYAEVKSVPELIESEWGREFVETLQGCQLGKTCSQNLSLANMSAVYADPAANNLINSVYSIGFALHAVLQQYCGSRYSGSCPQFLALSDSDRNEAVLTAILRIKFRDESSRVFSFSDIRDADFPLEIFSHRYPSSKTHQKIAVYPDSMNQTLKLNDRFYSSVRSVCENADQCPFCMANRGAFDFVSSTTVEDTPVTPPPTIKPSTVTPAILESVPSVFVNSEDDIILGGIFPIHGAGNTPFECGEINTDGLLSLEAFLWAIDTINQNPQLLQGMKIGAFAMDSCSSEAYAVSNLKRLLSTPYFERSGLKMENLFGFINSPRTDEALRVAEILRAYNVTNIGPDSPSGHFDNMDFSLRTSVPLREQCRSMIELMAQLNWDYVSIVYSESQVSLADLLSLRKNLESAGICVAEEVGMSRDIELKALERIILGLNKKRTIGSRAVMVLLGPEELSIFLRGVKAMQKANVFDATDFTFLMRTGADEELMKNWRTTSVGLGSIVMQYDSQPMEPFEEMLNTLSYASNGRNPWWQEYYRSVYSCSDVATCSSIRQPGNHGPISPTVANVVNGVFAMAVGLGNLQQEYCRQEKGFCASLRNQSNLRDLIYSKVRNVAFSRGDSLGDTFEFGLDGWGSSNLHLLNVVPTKSDSANPSDFTVRKVGTYRNGNLTMKIVPMSFPNDKPVPLRRLTSSCSEMEGCTDCSSSAKQQVPDKSLPAKQSLTVQQENFLQPPHRSQDDHLFVYRPSNDSLLIPAVMALHERGNNGLNCGEIIGPETQNLEGLLWAIEQVNQDPVLLPGLSLGTVVLDSCSEGSRGVTELSSFLSASSSIGSSITDTMAVISSSENELEAMSVCSVAARFGKTCIATRSKINPADAGFTRNKNLMAHSVFSVDFEAKVLSDTIVSLEWRSVAILHSQDLSYSQGAKKLQQYLEQRDICIPFTQPISTSFCDEDDSTLISQLLTLRQRGTYGVSLWLNADDLICFLKAINAAISTGQIKSGDFSWLLPSGVPDMSATLLGYEAAAVGVIYLDSHRKEIAEFEQYWKSLGIDESKNNPWREELLSVAEACTGVDCFKLNEYRENANLLNTMNAVFSAAYALDDLRKRVCGVGSRGLCPGLRKDPKLSQRIHNSLTNVSFVDASGHMFRFDKDLFGNHNVALKSLIVTGNGYELRMVGAFHKRKGLILQSPLQGFQNGVEPFNLRSRTSKCDNCSQCQYINDSLLNPKPGRARQPTLTTQTPIKSQGSVHTSLTANLPQHDFYLAGVFPIHEVAGNGVLECGPFNPSSGFQQMAAFLFAVQEVNHDPYLLSTIELGAIPIDTCSSEERAVSSLFQLLSSPSYGPERAVSVFGLEDKNEPSCGQMLRSLSIPQINVQPTSMILKGDRRVFGTVPADDVVSEIMHSVAEQMNWSYVSVVVEESPVYTAAGDHFIVKAGDHGTCIARKVSIPHKASLEEAQIAVRQLVLAADARAVALFVSNDIMLKLMEALWLESVAPARFIFLSTYDEDWTYDKNFRTSLGSFTQGLVSVEVQRYNNTKFIEFLQSLTPESYDPIPSEWFFEFWQHEFECHVPGSPHSLKHFYSRRCSGDEKLDGATFAQSPTVLPTVLGVHAAARGLEKFLTHACPGREVSSLKDCKMQDPHSDLADAIRASNFTYLHTPEKEPIRVNFDSDGFHEAEFSVRNLLKQDPLSYQYEEVGIWRPTTGLMLDSKKVRVLDSRGVPEVPASVCKNDCTECPAGLNPLAHAQRISIKERFTSVWGVAIASMAGLGMLVCVICALYFCFTFPVAYGTTVCGYVLLFGLFSVYALSILFIFPPSDATCSLRRLATGICWAFVYGPLLVKAIYSWQLVCKPDREESSGTPRTSPFVLFCLTLGLATVQIVIGVEWIVLDSSGGLVLVENQWRCSPGEGFERSLVFSLPFVLLLIALTTLFSLLGWQSETHSKESRWIFITSLFTVAIWIAWTLLVTMLPLRIRDPAIAISMATNATVILLGIFMRKAYLHQKHREEIHAFMSEGSVYQNAGVTPNYGEPGSVYGMKGAHSIYQQQVPALPPPNASGVDHGAIIFQNTAYDGGSEFNPTKSELTARS